MTKRPVRGYQREDGTKVSDYKREQPKSGERRGADPNVAAAASAAAEQAAAASRADATAVDTANLSDATEHDTNEHLEFVDALRDTITESIRDSVDKVFNEQSMFLEVYHELTYQVEETLKDHPDWPKFDYDDNDYSDEDEQKDSARRKQIETQLADCALEIVETMRDSTKNVAWQPK